MIKQSIRHAQELAETSRKILREDGFVELVKCILNYSKTFDTKKYFATTINHKEAMRWFGRRKYLYDKLISTVYPYVSSDAIIFDIGANIGYFTMLLAERL